MITRTIVSDTEVSYDLGNGHVVTDTIEDDVGTARLVRRGEGGHKISDVTDGGGHVEERNLPPTPETWERSGF